jgi:hypothetical protein
MRRLTILLGLSAALLLAVVALAVEAPSVDWHVIGGGGERLVKGEYAVEATLGQAVVGVVDHDAYTLCAGYWCGAQSTYMLYLPLASR